MDRAEYQALLQAQEIYVNRLHSDTSFTAALLCEMHRDWLGGIYEWAGAYRTVELAKGDFQWPPAHLVSANMATFEAGMLREHTPCRPAPLSEVTRRLAEVHAELLLIHPFREGNGRLGRWLADLMALQAGYDLPEYGFRGRGAKARQARYLEAVKQGYLENYGALAAFFLEALERRLTRSG
jgi:cell filamentation protein